MKIGILTQPLGSNYGGILQNYALQKVLKAMGHEVRTIDFTPLLGVNKSMKTYLHEIASYLIKHAVFYPTRIYNRLPWQDDLKYMKYFVRKNIPLFSCLKSPEEEYPKFDAYVVGSDQVWRPCYNKKTLSWMYCDFLPEDSESPVVTYAASFGVGEWEYTPEQTKMVRRNISRFKALSVREASGVRLCREYLGVDAVHVLDPTLLLTPSDYMILVPKRTLSKVPERCVGVYILDPTERKRKIVEAVCRALGKRPVYFGCMKEGKMKFPTVESWLAHFERSAFIITDSFHGTAFSINFQRPFISIVNATRGADRFTSLLDSVGLQERLLSEETALDRVEDLVKNEMDWDAVNCRLSAMRDFSIGFLEKALR